MSNLTTSSSTVAATVTAFLALTTPFVPQPACKHGFEIITDTMSSSRDVYLVSDPANSDYSSCQPEQYRREKSHSYSPGVCPDSWNYINMATFNVITTEISDSSIVPVTRTISSAHCCRSNYAIKSETTGPLARLGPFCLETYKVHNEATPHSTLLRSNGAVEIFSTGREIHPAMWIAWESADISTLSPEPPALTSAMRIPTWTPGMTIYKGFYDNNGAGAPPGTEWEYQREHIRTFGLALGIPLFFLILICSSCCYCCCVSSKKKKAGEAENPSLAVEEAANRHDDRTNVVEMDAPPRYSP